MTEEEKAAAEAAAQKATEEAAAAEAARKAAAEKTGGEDAGADAAAELEKVKAELATARAEAAKFDGIDPVKAKADAAAVAAAEKAKLEAEKAKAEAEGNFEKLKELQDAETASRLEAANAATEQAKADAEAARKEARNARLSAAFATSKFLDAETILTPGKAEAIYGAHVEIENGVPIVFDAPSTAAKRAKIMDAKGNPLPFDQAMKKVIEADPDKDALLKSKIAPGGGSKTVDAPSSEKRAGDRLSRLAAGIKQLRES